MSHPTKKTRGTLLPGYQGIDVEIADLTCFLGKNSMNKCGAVQGYLAHENLPPVGPYNHLMPRDLYGDPVGVAISYERGTSAPRSLLNDGGLTAARMHDSFVPLKPKP